ncbi:MAG TPA: hypothetical protein VK922_17245 [Gemmatimonadaceae bacterium]|nr:hypothetical protein [Gemmatimonadaceae bacterium]
MRLALALATVALALAAPGCSSDGPTGNPNLVRYVAIQGGDQMNVGAFGPLQLTAFALNADRVEVEPGTFTFTWRSLDPAVAVAVSGGLITVFQNGTARIVAQVGAAADTITLNVQQVASRITFAQDTAVALEEGAEHLSGDVLPSDTLFVVARRADANGNAMPSGAGGAITWSSGSTLLALVPIAGTDSAKIIGTSPGSGSITAAIPGLASAQLPFQVVERYAVVRMNKPNVPGAVTQIIPATVTIPAGAAVVFRSADQDLHAAVSNSAEWRTSALKGPTGREAQRFGNAGSHAYKVENTAGTVVVQ